MVVIFSYFFEAGVGLAVGLTLGFMPGFLFVRWLIKRSKEKDVNKYIGRQTKVVANS